MPCHCHDFLSILNYLLAADRNRRAHGGARSRMDSPFKSNCSINPNQQCIGLEEARILGD